MVGQHDWWTDIAKGSKSGSNVHIQITLHSQSQPLIEKVKKKWHNSNSNYCHYYAIFFNANTCSNRRNDSLQQSVLLSEVLFI